MELKEAVANRRSIRCFLDKPVSEETVGRILEDSLWAPSWGNTQPFEVVAAMGPALTQFKKENREALLSGVAAASDVTMPDSWPGPLKDRYRGLGIKVLESLSIPRGDQEARLNYYADMFALFDAPALVLLTVDRELSLEYAMLDVGLFLQTFCLLAHEQGLGTCILAASVNYPDIARRIFNLPENKLLIMGAALGWPDPEAPVNLFERKRGVFEEMVHLVR